MPENKIPPFVQLKKLFKECGLQAGERLSDRQAHRMTQGFLLSSAAEQYFLNYSDDTGEDAVKNVLINYLRQYKNLKGVAA